MRTFASAVIPALMVASCSSSSGDGGTGGGSVDSSSSAGGGTSSAGGGDVGGPSGDSSSPGSGAIGATTHAGAGTGTGGEGPTNRNAATDRAWRRFQGELSTDDATGLRARRVLGCAVDAPGISPLAVYVERTNPGTDDPPDRQFIVTFAADPGGDSLTATATILRLLEPEAWTGRCEPDVVLPLLGSVTAEDACVIHFTQDDASTELFFEPEEPVSASCFAPATEAEGIQPHWIVTEGRIDWADLVVDGDGSTTEDPPSVPYELVRRTEAPEGPDR